MDDMTLQQYINMYKQPLNESSMKAILQLTEVAVENPKPASQFRLQIKMLSRGQTRRPKKMWLEERMWASRGAGNKKAKKEKKKGMIQKKEAHAVALA
jgi:hypothetical protein